MTETLSRTGLCTGHDSLGIAADMAEGAASSRPLVSIVVPYYNPGDGLRAAVADMMRVLDASGVSFEIITVSDGSTDGSPGTLDQFPERVVQRVAYATNVGKGQALRTGLALGSGRYLGFIDADGDIAPEFLCSFIAVMQTEGPDIVVGSKRHPDSSVHWTPMRRLYSWAHQCLIRRLFRMEVKDTQVGIKLMDRQVVSDVLPMLRENRFALDLELLVLAQRLGYTRIVEAPVRIEERCNSTISFKRAWRLLADTVGFFIRLSIRREYEDGIASRSRFDGRVLAERRGAPIPAPAIPEPLSA